MVGPQHKDVMRDIRIILEQLDELKIAPISYGDIPTRYHKCFKK